MIISHKHKFIFPKPTKVASTSVEVSLAKHCEEKDIVTPISDYSKDSDEDKYDQQARNYDGFYNHIPPEEIKEKIDQKIWDEYFKFTIIRNPWDLAVSRYFWEISKKETYRELLSLKNILSKPLSIKTHLRHLRLYLSKKVSSFGEFVDNFEEEWTNTRYYFDKEGNPICNFYIKYENLNEDYKEVCEKIGIPFEELPRLKTKQRKDKSHYSNFYNEETKGKIREIFKKDVEYFKYAF